MSCTDSARLGFAWHGSFASFLTSRTNLPGTVSPGPVQTEFKARASEKEHRVKGREDGGGAEAEGEGKTTVAAAGKSWTK